MEKYMIFYGAGIGDFATILPLAYTIKSQNKNSYIECFNCSNKEKININLSLLKNQKFVDKISYYNKSEFIHTLFFLLKNIRKFEYVYVLTHIDNKSTSVWPFFIAKIIGNKTCFLEMKNKKVPKADIYVERNNDINFYEAYLEMAYKTGFRKILIPNSLFDKNKILAAANQEIIKKCNTSNQLCLTVGTGKIAVQIDGHNDIVDLKSWSVENWVDLSNKLVKLGYNVILIGGKQEEKLFSNAILNKDVVNLLGKCSVIDSLAIMSNSMLVIGADTGMVHCAAALGVSNLTLYGCTYYKNYLPIWHNSYFICSKKECSPCFGFINSINCKHNSCMDEIKVDDVVSEANKIYLHTNSNQQHLDNEYR